MRKLVSVIAVISVLSIGVSLRANSAHAASLNYASASASTSRPSASAPLSTDPLAIGSAQATVLDNGSTYLASDAAKLYKAGVYSEALTVATTSANKTTLYFTSSNTVAQNKTTVITVPITAVHTIAFTTQTAIPNGGKIYIQYPSTTSGSDTNQASPSASSYMFNGLATGDIIVKVGVGGTGTISCGTVTAGSNGTAPSVTCTATGSINTNVPIWIFLGCAAINTSSSTAPFCSTPTPKIINPTYTATGGVRNNYNISVQTQDASSNVLDSTILKMATIESVFVIAHVDPTFTFRIDGVSASTAMNTTATCGTAFAALTTSSTYPSTNTEVNLGTLTNLSDTYLAQKMTITSNTVAGYAITATSSGFLINPATGYYVPNINGNVTANNTPAPQAANSSTGGFGIHPCDAQTYANTHVLKTLWYSAGSKSNPLFANPSASFYYTLVNWGDPLGNENSVTYGRDVIYSLYWAAAAASTPPGDYTLIMTYNASPTF